MSEKILRSKIIPKICPFTTVGECVWYKIQKLNQESVCLIEAETDERLTIGELKTQSNSIAMALIERGITKSDIIAFSGNNSIQHSVLRFVAYFLGNTFMPLSPTFEKYEVEQVLTEVNANVVFTSAQDLYKFDNILNKELNNNNNKNNIKIVVVFDGKDDKYITFEQLLKEGKNQRLDKIPYFEVNPEIDMFYIVHTSGTTGKPKCVQMRHGACLNIIPDSIASKDANKVTVVAVLYPYGHVSGTLFLPTQVIAGATQIVFRKYDEELLYKSIEKYRITLLPAFPHFGRKLIESDVSQRYDLSSLKMIITGGAAFPGHIAKAITV